MVNISLQDNWTLPSHAIRFAMQKPSEHKPTVSDVKLFNVSMF
jgi:hypothetical protein